MRTRAEVSSAFAPSTALDRADTYYLVGIGGAGMSALARLLASRGLSVAGFDRSDSEVVRALRKTGVPVDLKLPTAAALEGAVVVLSDAIDLDQDPIVALAREAGHPIVRRSQLLGWSVRGKKTIAVTGTHGKTTTTAMLGVALRAAGLDPTIIAGAEARQLGSSAIDGDGQWAVIEACEAYDSLRDIDPTLVVLTNLEPDHLDFHGDWDSLKGAMRAFLDRIPADGMLIHRSDDPGTTEAIDGYAGPKTAFEPLPNSVLRGRVNRLNAGAALEVCRTIGLTSDQMVRAEAAVVGFQGVARRLERVASGEIDLYVDYAHHPTEIEACIETLREVHPGRRIVAVFQPHLYSRTLDLLNGFRSSLAKADFVVLTDIYPAREEPVPGVSSALIAEGLSAPVLYVPSRHVLPFEVPRRLKSGDVCVLMGAGNIAESAMAFEKALQPKVATSVAVVYGGDSSEREVSLHSGRAVAAALIARGYSVSMLDVTEWLHAGTEPEVFRGEKRPDVVFLAVHGTNAEDGALQGFFELLHIPYTGSNVLASALCMDKQRTKTMLAAAGLPVPSGVAVRSPDEIVRVPQGDRFVVKPNAQGSTVGLTFVETRSKLKEAIAYALRFDKVALVEQWVRGMEISVPVLGNKALPVVEIVPASGRYDFSAKYTVGATEEVCPARLPEETLAKAQDLAVAAHKAMGCSGATRTDMIVRENGEIVILEVNTLPGLTPTSLLPRAALAADLSFEDLCEWIVKEALARRAAAT